MIGNPLLYSLQQAVSQEIFDKLVYPLLDFFLRSIIFLLCFQYGFYRSFRNLKQSPQESAGVI